jgi:hypothetical protein
LSSFEEFRRFWNEDLQGMSLAQLRWEKMRLVSALAREEAVGSRLMRDPDGNFVSAVSWLRARAKAVDSRLREHNRGRT